MRCTTFTYTANEDLENNTIMPWFVYKVNSKFPLFCNQCLILASIRGKTELITGIIKLI